MFIAVAVRAWNKLRQERHGVGLCKHRDRQAVNQAHAAPSGAWMVLWGSFSIDMALRTELPRTLIPPRTATNPCFGSALFSVESNAAWKGERASAVSSPSREPPVHHGIPDEQSARSQALRAEMAIAPPPAKPPSSSGAGFSTHSGSAGLRLGPAAPPGRPTHLAPLELARGGR
jgi:hypothetical protein